jgi:GH18 family chitinase
LHFAFATLTPDYQVHVGDLLSTYEFTVFRGLQGPKRILSIGGWEFSTNPSTYLVFREGVKPANRPTMAGNIAKFVTDNGLDGVDIDWEYPGVRTNNIPTLFPIVQIPWFRF